MSDTPTKPSILSEKLLKALYNTYLVGLGLTDKQILCVAQFSRALEHEVLKESSTMKENHDRAKH